MTARTEHWVKEEPVDSRNSSTKKRTFEDPQKKKYEFAADEGGKWVLTGAEIQRGWAVMLAAARTITVFLWMNCETWEQIVTLAKQTAVRLKLIYRGKRVQLACPKYGICGCKYYSADKKGKPATDGLWAHMYSMMNNEAKEWDENLICHPAKPFIDQICNTHDDRTPEEQMSHVRDLRESGHYTEEHQRYAAGQREPKTKASRSSSSAVTSIKKEPTYTDTAWETAGTWGDEGEDAGDLTEEREEDEANEETEEKEEWAEWAAGEDEDAQEEDEADPEEKEEAWIEEEWEEQGETWDQASWGTTTSSHPPTRKKTTRWVKVRPEPATEPTPPREPIGTMRRKEKGPAPPREPPWWKGWGKGYGKSKKGGQWW